MSGSLQRRRGETIRIYKTGEAENRRGDVVRSPTADYHEVRAAVVADRSARAEVPGQMQIDVVRFLVPHKLENVDLWSRIWWDGRWWDIAAPPALRIGRHRHNRHWTIVARARPDDGGIPGVG